jgi:Cytochrome P460
MFADLAPKYDRHQGDCDAATSIHATNAADASPPGSAKRIAALMFVAMAVGWGIASTPFAFGNADGEESSPTFGVQILAGYRQWELIAPSHEEGFDELRGIVGNALSMKAYREGTLPFPDGAILAKLAWKRVPSSEFRGAFVPGAATTFQIMVKDSKKYASTGGWGFGRFVDGKPADEAHHKTYLPCHEANVKAHDLVFTQFAP